MTPDDVMVGDVTAGELADAASALRSALYRRLVADPGVLAALGGPAVHDAVPRGLSPPYLVLGEGGVKDWSTSSDHEGGGLGHEHAVQLVAWTGGGGSAEAFRIADAAAACLAAMPPGALPGGHRLVNLVALGTEVRRERDGRLVRATLRLRAVTEVI